MFSEKNAKIFRKIFTFGALWGKIIIIISRRYNGSSEAIQQGKVQEFSQKFQVKNANFQQF